MSRLSLIGIDVGSTGTKITAYDLNGKALGSVYSAHTPHHPFPGAWELDPEEIWNNAAKGLRDLTANEYVRKDPPKAIAISASTREGFPVDGEGRALGPCIMTADTRESGLEKEIASKYSPEQWFEFCGHLPERMDPVCRMLWWEKNHPDVMSKAKHFLGWGEFFCLRLTGQPVVDRSHAARHFVYDFNTHGWSPERIREFKIRGDLLPEVRPWSSIIGLVKSDIASRLGLGSGVQLAVGANDAVCCVLGAGVAQAGVGCMISGSWENLLLPVSTPPPADQLVKLGVSIGPYPGKAGWMIYCLSPTGNAVMNWVRDLVNLKVEEAESKIAAMDKGPGHVVAVPHVSGAISPWVGGSKLRAALLGMTLATAPADVVKAMMESIAFDMAFLIAALKQAGARVDEVRAVGGGTRSAWWTQLKSDLTNTAIETVDQPELGTLGAALFAGQALALWGDIEERAGAFTKPSEQYQPNAQRAVLYKERMKVYKSIIADWLGKDWTSLLAN